MTAIYSITLWRGATGTKANDAGFVFDWLDNDNQPVDTDGVEVIFVARDAARNIVLRKTSTDGGVLIDGNRITVPFTVEETRNTTPNVSQIRYEIEYRPDDGVERPILTGFLILEGGINDDG